MDTLSQEQSARPRPGRTLQATGKCKLFSKKPLGSFNRGDVSMWWDLHFQRYIWLLCEKGNLGSTSGRERKIHREMIAGV